MTKTEIELFNKCSNLEGENEKLKLQLKSFEENVTRIITNFWCWYVSGNHKRDLSAKEEGLKYANNFFHDLIQESDEIKENYMFEKQAEEYYYKTYPVTLNIGEEERKEKVTDIFIKGAEFGYNKAKEDADKMKSSFH